MEPVIQVCQLDLADLHVPLTQDRALGLQTELWERFTTIEFQSQLTKYEKAYGLDTPKYRKMQQMLVLDVQSEVLPKYGYEASVDGVAEMRLEFQRFEADPEVSANREVINRLIGKSKDDPHWESDPAVSEPTAPKPGVGLPYPSKAAPRAASLEHPLQHSRRARSLSPGFDSQGIPFNRSRRAGSNRPIRPHLSPRAKPLERRNGKLLMPKNICQLDIDDVTVPFERPQVLGLQRELCEVFRAEDFQSRLRSCEEEHGEGSADFRKQQQQLVLGVQAQVLPKYGFEGSVEGVAQMRTEISKRFSDDAEIQANTSAINTLIGKTWGAKRGEQGCALALRDVEQNISEWARAPQVPMIQYELVAMHVSSGDGYWVVTGGAKHGGLRVRLGEHMTSKATGLLARGAVVKEVQLIHGRLCFEKISGRGPNYGWVSLQVRGVNLLEHYEGGIPSVTKAIKMPALEDVPKALPPAPMGEFEELAL